MATNYNITMKRYNGTDYDVLYPRTLPSQIDGGVYTKDEATGLFLSKTGGQMSGLLDMNGNKISNLAAPTAANDAATKDYVDNNSYIQTKTLVKSLSQSEIASLNSGSPIQAFSVDDYINGGYTSVITKIKNLNMSITSSISLEQELLFGAFMWYGQYSSQAISISGTKTYQVSPAVSYNLGEAKLYAVTNISSNDYCYEVNKLGTITSISELSVSADSIEIYLCK